MTQTRTTAGSAASYCSGACVPVAPAAIAATHAARSSVAGPARRMAARSRNAPPWQRLQRGRRGGSNTPSTSAERPGARYGVRTRGAKHCARLPASFLAALQLPGSLVLPGVCARVENAPSPRLRGGSGKGCACALPWRRRFDAPRRGDGARRRCGGAAPRRPPPGRPSRRLRLRARLRRPSGRGGGARRWIFRRFRPRQRRLMSCCWMAHTSRARCAPARASCTPGARLTTPHPFPAGCLRPRAAASRARLHHSAPRRRGARILRLSASRAHRARALTCAPAAVRRCSLG